jgi:hypothetical protein
MGVSIGDAEKGAGIVFEDVVGQAGGVRKLERAGDTHVERIVAAAQQAAGIGVGAQQVQGGPVVGERVEPQIAERVGGGTAAAAADIGTLLPAVLPSADERGCAPAADRCAARAACPRRRPG